MNDSKKTDSNKRNNRRRRYNNKNRGQNKKTEAKSSNNSSGNNKNRRKFSKNRRPKSLTPSRIVQKYENLLEQYVQARRKFFEVFGRGSTKQVDKVERNYDNALRNLRNFEFDLKEDWQKDVLNQKINGYPEDRQYSSEHNLTPKGDEISHVGDFEDPHLLPTQKASNWAEDTEESIGTMEDYQHYKDNVVKH